MSKYITEDYVSCETAKLLRDKGFVGNVHAYHNIFDGVNLDYKLNEAPHLNIPAPTLQMAMKWLREEHNIFIVVERHIYDYINEKNSSYVTSLWKGDNYYENVTSKDYPTYEEAVEATIKYCLEDLI